MIYQIKLVFIAFLLGSFLVTGNWEQRIDKKGVKVFVKDVPTSKIKSIKSTTIINATPEKVAFVLMDFPNYPKWVYNCPEARVLKKVNDKEYYYYQVTSAPWPVSDRDMICHVTVTGSNNDITVHLLAAPSYMEEKSGFVRIKVFDSIWKLKKTGNATEAVNEFSTDPGGDVPAWLINAVIAEGPYQTTVKLKELAEKK